MPEQDFSNMSQEEIAEAQKQNCIFCKIVEGEVPSKQVYEDEYVIAILDIRPATEGHVLVLPKEHYPVLPVVPQDVTKHMFSLTKDLCNSIREGLPAMGTTVFMANGAAAGQQSPHFLFHIVPRESGDNLDAFSLPRNNVSQKGLKEPLREQLGKAMKALLAEEGKLPDQEEVSGEKRKQQVAQILQQNPDLRKALVQETEQFKKLVEQNPQMKKLFQGIDVDELASQLEGDSGNSRDSDDKEGADLDKVSRLFK